MKTSLTRDSASKVRVQVEATSEEVEPAVERAVRSLSNQVKVPGFRKGHVPRKVLETRLGADALRDAVLREAIPELLQKATEEETLAPIAPPQVEVTTYDLGKELTFEATIEVRPEIELPDFAMLSTTRPSTKATPEEIDDQLQRMQDRFSTLETIQRPSRVGDYLLVDIHTTLHGAEIAELSGNDQLYEVGTGWPVKELDDELTGKRTGDIVKFNATIPEALGGEHAGKEVTFQVLVKEVREKKLPALDDEFAKTSSEFETLDELRADLAQRIEKVKAIQSDAEVRNRILEQVLDDVEVEAPDSLVQSEMAYRLQRLEEQLRSAGMSLDQYLTAQNLTEEQIEGDLRTQADRNVRAQLILEEIGRREGFQVSEEELREEVRYHAETLRTDPAQLAKELGERGRLMALAGDIIRRKALNLLVERAEVKDEDSTEDEQGQEPESSDLKSSEPEPGAHVESESPELGA
ncbi:MAG TPA: trigger factor [Actinomycetota bacterium]|nr:trigger factor [Actinomycetota bacterium]